MIKEIKILSQITKKHLNNIHNNINVRIYIENNRYYFEYNSITKLFTWKNIINTKNIDLLRSIYDLRKMYVDKLLEIVIKNYGISCTNPLTRFNKYCKINALGSTSLTSNYNVTVSSFLFSTIIVSTFNNYFYNFWKDTSGEIFDTNFYGNSFFITIKKNLEYNKNLFNLYNHINIKDNILFYLPPQNTMLNEELKKKILDNQISWLIIKIHLYLDEYSNYFNSDRLKSLLKDMHDIILNNISMNNKNKINKNLLNKFKTLIQEKKYKSISENKLRKKLDKLYVSKLKIIDLFQIKYMKSNNDPKLLLDLLESISTSNFYGNETYFCLGTIYHVLGYIQKLGNFHMYPEYYIHSMIENFIDLFRYVEYIHTDCSKFILKGSKYIFRIYDAIINFIGKKNIEKLNDKKNLFSSIRSFYQTNSTKSLSNNLKTNLSEFYLDKKIITSINKDEIIMILEKIIVDIKYALNYE